jgi:hypothetical protein
MVFFIRYPQIATMMIMAMKATTLETVTMEPDRLARSIALAYSAVWWKASFIERGYLRVFMLPPIG